MSLRAPLLLLGGTCLFPVTSSAPPAQLLLAYFSGVGADSVGSGHLNSLALAFFDPAAMTASPASCNFSDASTPCLAPASGSGEKTLSWVLSSVAATQGQLAPNAAPAQPLYLLSFGGATCGGAAWDAMLSSPQLASNFGANAASLVAFLAARVPGAAFGVDLDVEGTTTPLPQLPALVAAYRAHAAYDTHPLQLCALSAFSAPDSADHAKTAADGGAGAKRHIARQFYGRQCRRPLHTVPRLVERERRRLSTAERPRRRSVGRDFSYIHPSRPRLRRALPLDARRRRWNRRLAVVDGRRQRHRCSHRRRKGVVWGGGN